MSDPFSPATAGLKAVKVVIYDCDGVLIDSRGSNRAYYNHILERFGLPPLTSAQLDFVQVSTAREAVDFLFQESPFREPAQAYQRDMDNTPFLALLQPEPHIREVLTALRPHYRLAIATNRGKSLPLVLGKFGWEALFDFTVSSYEVSAPKPHPEGLLKILEHFRVEPREACYLGDAAVDQEASSRAGVAFLAYKNQDLPAFHHLRDHRDLLKLLLPGPGRRIPKSEP